MTITLLAQTPCPCGYLWTVLMVGSARINKRSMRVTGGLLGAIGYKAFPWDKGSPSSCPECGTRLRSQREQGSETTRSAYVLHPDDAVRVAEYRARRWPETVAAGAASRELAG